MTGRAHRSWVRTGGLALLLGAVTNVLIVAPCVWNVSAQWGAAGRVGYWSDGERRFLVRMDRGPGKMVYRWEPEPPSRFGLLPGVRVPPTPPAWADLSVDLRTPENMAGAGAFAEYSSPVRYEIAYGWPWLCCQGGVVQIDWQRPAQRHDYWPALPELAGSPGVGLGPEPRTMPMRPMWAGLAGNVAVYGAAWWVLLVVPDAVRRWRRRRRGACVTCGYDRDGVAIDAACPECGYESPKRERRATAATVDPEM